MTLGSGGAAGAGAESVARARTGVMSRSVSRIWTVAGIGAMSGILSGTMSLIAGAHALMVSSGTVSGIVVAVVPSGTVSGIAVAVVSAGTLTLIPGTLTLIPGASRAFGTVRRRAVVAVIVISAASFDYGACQSHAQNEDGYCFEEPLHDNSILSC